MDYIELTCNLFPNNQENKEILEAFLSFAGYESFMETESGINAYINADDFNLKTVTQINDFNPEFEIKANFVRIPDRNWNEMWMNNYFKPIVIGDKLVVRATFHKDYPKTEHEIIIDPKRAFGTGNHPTTYMILKEILNSDMTGKEILDLGCGTAILAILAIKKGAHYALGIDNDINACKNAEENIMFNSVKGIKIVQGTASYLKEKKFDFIIENIWKNIVISDLPILYKHSKLDGFVFLSGFLIEDAADVILKASEIGFTFVSKQEMGEWAMVVVQKKEISEMN